MYKDFLKSHINSGANYVEYGYGQVEPNLLSAQKTGQLFAQLPADASIEKLEQGQFAKYDYAAGVVNFTGAGEWMLVFNEIKLPRAEQADCEFAMVKGDYSAMVYSPVEADPFMTKQSRYYNGVDSEGNTSYTASPAEYAASTDTSVVSGKTYYTKSGDIYTVVENPSGDPSTKGYYEMTKEAVVYNYSDVTKPNDYWEPNYNEDPFHIDGRAHEAMMPAGTTMVPRLFKTNLYDIFTTNTIIVEGAGEGGAVLGTELAIGDTLGVGANGYLTNITGNFSGDMRWQVVKVYTMPDHQRGVKIMRIA